MYSLYLEIYKIYIYIYKNPKRLGLLHTHVFISPSRLSIVWSVCYESRHLLYMCWVFLSWFKWPTISGFVEVELN